MSEDRLSRIETKLDLLTDAMVSLARMEEKMVTLFRRMDKYDDAQSKIDGRLLLVEKASLKAGTFGYMADKAFWIILGIGLTALAKTVGA